MKRMLISIFVVFAILFAVSFALNETAIENSREEHLEILQTLLPGTTECTVEPYSGEDPVIRSVHKGENGYIIETVTNGYADEIRMYIGVSNAGKVTGLVVREAHETLGLGSKILTDHVFLSQFLNKTGSFAIAENEADAFTGATAVAEPEGDSTDADAITGATVSSKAVVRCVNSAVAYVTGADAVSSATTWGG